MSTQSREVGRAAPAAVAAPMPQIDPVPRVSIQAFCETPDSPAIVQAAIGDRRMRKAHVKQNMGGAAAAVEAYRNAPTPNVIVLEATRQSRLAGRATRRALAIIATPAPRSSCIGQVNDIVLYRQLMARGRQRISGRAVHRRRVRSARSPTCSAAPAPSRSAASSSVIGAKGGVGASTDRAQSRLAVRHRSRRCRRSSPTSTSASAPPASTTTKTRRKASPRRCSRPNASMPPGRPAAVEMRRESEPARGARDARPPLRLRRDRRSTRSSTRCAPRRRGSCSTFPTPGTAGRGACWSAPTRSSSSPRPISPICATPRTSWTTFAARGPTTIRRAWCSTASACRSGRKSPSPDFAKTVEVEPIAVIPHDAKLFGSAANNGQMIAEIEPKGKVSRDFRRLAGLLAGRAETQEARSAACSIRFWRS